jgi:hypothetical protein
MNRSRTVLTITWISFALISCTSQTGRAGVKASTLGTPGGAQGRDTLYEHLQEFDGVGLSVVRDRSYFPETVLLRLHSWLAEHKGLTRETVDGHSALILNDLSEKVFNDLIDETFPENFKSGFEILQGSFWKGIQDLRDQGVQVGFLEPDPQFKVSGVFFSERKLILVDIFASEGTLTHETRHYLQSVQLQKREEQAESFRYNENDAPLGDDCLAQASRFFAELDATTTELPIWQGVFETLNTTPGWHKTAKQGDLDPVRFPQISLLQDNLDYPGMAAAWLQNSDCPYELMNVVGQIKRATDQVATQITSQYAEKLFTLRMEDLHDWSYENTRCTSAPTLDPSIAPACTQRATRIGLIPQESETLSSEIDSQIAAESTARPVLIRRLLSTLSDDLQKQLCRHAQGFEFLSDCETYFEQMN